jgi:hypothetical protein
MKICKSPDRARLLAEIERLRSQQLNTQEELLVRFLSCQEQQTASQIVGRASNQFQRGPHLPTPSALLPWLG